LVPILLLIPVGAGAYEPLQQLPVERPSPRLQLADAGGGAGDVAAPAPGADGSAQPHAARSERALTVREAVGNNLSLMSHKTNYLLPLSYTRDLPRYGEVDGADAYRSAELEFQLSVQVPLWEGLLGEDSFVSLAYTNHSFWQAYTPSAPFRETIHEPELLMTWLSDWHLFGFQCVASQFGLNHQSNGRGGEFSRGWNRIYSRFIFERGDFYYSFKPWYRLPEDRVGDDNRDIESYLGHFELVGGYRGANYAASVMVRNNLRSDNRGAVELRWSFPLSQRVRGFVKYFNGYGETLLNYSDSVQTIGIGVELAQGF